MVDVSAPPKRRLPFKPTALRQKKEPKSDKIEIEDSSDSDGGLDLFKRSKSFFPKALAQQEALRKRKSSVEDVKPPTTPKNKGKQKETWPPLKQSPDADRRSKLPPIKLSDESDDPDSVKTPPSKRSRHSLSSVASHSGGRRDRDKTRHDASPSKSASKSIPCHSPRVKSESFHGNPVIALNDSEDEDVKPTIHNDDIYEATPIRKFRHSPVPEPVVTDIPSSPEPFLSDKDDDTDEFAEFVRAARERQEKAKEASSQNQSEKPTAILLFVTSEIPGAQERKIKCGLDKRFHIVKEAWCAGQHLREFAAEEQEDIFLTFRGRRLYDSTTVASLGVRITATGELALASAQSWSDREGILDSMGALQIEAWTEETWEVAQKQKERARLRDLGELDDDSQEGDGADEEEAPEPEEETIKVILKTRDNDKETVKARARPLTTIDELIVYFRRARNLPETTPIVLQFDGEQLDGATTLQDAEIEDMDAIEVHIKG
ncbi:ubiquitin-2 like Rad60 SUMO-like-domain-containing protein [Plectosphaerella cucumerina]|uniref:Ubiquitin-2 like Rad60 SUMO-like-domain-containing protein n=1 Tax=Plectosphaerella cucumerina TaxID=40658 RepID=A0A8K0TEH3_9PEZI|nr:ubiquitin-2 like Rad60 SUMO-like-domain-containing protein [Plectosphaerella cucumerina]